LLRGPFSDEDKTLDLKWLGDFECLARTLNFTRAATERNITQSAFSRRIKALESWVGAPLINRAQYPVQLTDAGAQFLPVALAAVSHLTGRAAFSAIFSASHFIG
jgi:DNA-binding transcriptional LysR family regulator